MQEICGFYRYLFCLLIKSHHAISANTNYFQHPQEWIQLQASVLTMLTIVWYLAICSVFMFLYHVYLRFWWGNLRERDHLEDSVVDDKIILKWIFKTWDVGHGLYWSAQNKDKWQAVVNAVMNIRFHKMRGISWLDENRLASQEGLCCMELVSCLVVWLVS